MGKKSAMKRIHDIPNGVRMEYARTVAAALAKVFSDAAHGPAYGLVAAAGVKTSLRNVCTPYTQR